MSHNMHRCTANIEQMGGTVVGDTEDNIT